MEYLKRIADGQLALRLEAFGAVQIKGPKWCGKTTTAEQQARSVIKLQNPDTRAGYLYCTYEAFDPTEGRNAPLD